MSRRPRRRAARRGTRRSRRRRARRSSGRPASRGALRADRDVVVQRTVVRQRRAPRQLEDRPRLAVHVVEVDAAIDGERRSARRALRLGGQREVRARSRRRAPRSATCRRARGLEAQHLAASARSARARRRDGARRRPSRASPCRMAGRRRDAEASSASRCAASGSSAGDFNVGGSRRASGSPGLVILTVRRAGEPARRRPAPRRRSSTRASSITGWWSDACVARSTCTRAHARPQLRADEDEVAVQLGLAGHPSSRRCGTSPDAARRVREVPGVGERRRAVGERRQHPRVQRVVGLEVEVAGDDRRRRPQVACGTARRSSSAIAPGARVRRGPRRRSRAAPRPARCAAVSE